VRIEALRVEVLAVLKGEFAERDVFPDVAADVVPVGACGSLLAFFGG
jgi:hypothetical protein